MRSRPGGIKSNTKSALADPILREALAKLKTGFQAKRKLAAANLPEFDALRDQARDMKKAVLEDLDSHLDLFEAKVTEQGGRVHWAETAQDARDIVLSICKQAGAKLVAKGKSMISEEIMLNHWLEEHGLEVVETDLGEYIIQLRKEPPSHIIAPAIHLDRRQVAKAFRERHHELAADRPLDEPRALLDEARAILRQKFLEADVGITGANFLIAETGSIVLVTNEGNGDLTQTLPRIHIVLASIEKVVPTLEAASLAVRLLARSATGQEMTSYTTVTTGPKREGDLDGPDEFHIILLDNGRTAMMGGPFEDMLRCIRCAACINHCPVYGAIGGHAYASFYCGPMGSVLTPALAGLEDWAEMPDASTFCGRCEQVCPMRIPLPRMMRTWRERAFERGITPAATRHGLSLWGFMARRPWLYRLAVDMAVPVLSLLAGRKGRFASLPLASGWTKSRDLPAPEGKSFLSQWAAFKKGRDA
ncbi:MAG: LutB/LldF family L-lactate oxidation iron-sulfur protein [Rhodospirillales bacterium]|nr:LutB/LldF family L-lactate oxidation iron-sulfur protein [Rhodospirillales bacterium]